MALFSVLMEVLSNMSTLPGSLELIARFLLVLHNVLHADVSHVGDRSYLEQLIMSAIDHSAQKITVTTTANFKQTTANCVLFRILTQA